MHAVPHALMPQPAHHVGEGQRVRIVRSGGPVAGRFHHPHDSPRQLDEPAEPACGVRAVEEQVFREQHQVGKACQRPEDLFVFGLRNHQSHQPVYLSIANPGECQRVVTKPVEGHPLHSVLPRCLNERAACCRQRTVEGRKDELARTLHMDSVL